MHKMKKKVFQDLLIFVLALFLSTGATNVLAEEEVFWESEDGNYEYKIVAEKGACITMCFRTDFSPLGMKPLLAVSLWTVSCSRKD